MMRRALVARCGASAAFLLLAAFAGCSLLVDTNGLTGSQPHDAGPTPDGTATGDAGCGHALCDDFDDGPIGGPPWTGQILSGGGSLRLDFDASVSPPASLLASCPGAEGLARLVWATDGGAKTIACAFELLLDAAPSGGDEHELFQILFDAPQGKLNGYNLSLHASSTETHVIEYADLPDGGSMYNSFPFAPPPYGRWTLVEMRVDLASPNVTLAVAGANVVAQALTPASGIRGQSVRIGMQIYGGGSAYSAHFDDVRCDVTR
jgi:hypothetical protein